MITSEEREGGRDKIGVWDKEIQITMYKTGKQQRYIVQHKDIIAITL